MYSDQQCVWVGYLRPGLYSVKYSMFGGLHFVVHAHKIFIARAAFIFLQKVNGNDKLVHSQPALSKSQWGSAVQGGVVTRELSFGLSSPQTGTQQENSALQAGVKQENGGLVQHVESLGAWAQNEAHRKPSIKLEG